MNEIVLIFGSGGLIGEYLLSEIKKHNILYYSPESKLINISNFDVLQDYITNKNPTTIINLASLMNLDYSENNRREIVETNILGNFNLVYLCKKFGIDYLYTSTDYVFCSDSLREFKTDDDTNPINFYGRTKEISELRIKDYLTNYYIVRTSWIYGGKNNCFVKKIIDQSKISTQVSVVDTEYGSPTYALDFSRAILIILKNRKYGVYHIVNNGFMNRFQLARHVVNKLGVDLNLIPIKSYPRNIAKRPLEVKLNASLNPIYIPIRDFDEAFEEFMTSNNEEKH